MLSCFDGVMYIATNVATNTTSHTEFGDATAQVLRTYSLELSRNSNRWRTVERTRRRL